MNAGAATDGISDQLFPDPFILPGYDAAGNLPLGVHSCTFDSLAVATCFNEDRRRMWLQLMGFLAWPILNRNFRHAYIGGGFVSTKPVPKDVDVVLETTSPYGPEAFTTVSRFFAAGLDQIEIIYGVHLQFWMKNAPSEMADYRRFFQYARPDAFTAVLNRSRGIAKLALTGPEAIAGVRKHLRGEFRLEGQRSDRS